jgi:hypothetical protein
MFWKLPGFLIYVYLAQENVFRFILVCNINVLWGVKIAAAIACKEMARLTENTVWKNMQ